MVTLNEIVSAVRRRLEQVKGGADLRKLEEQAAKHQVRGFRKALVQASGGGPAIVAELKKASPSRGAIRGSFPAGRLAMDLAEAGAAALSVLTEEEFFQGSLANLCEAWAATGIPCLRKDFVVDEFQVLEARANHADAVLLIAAVLTDDELSGLLKRARATGLDALCEVHDERELERVLDAGADLVGVNSRDLRTFAVDLQTALRLGPRIPAQVVRVAESGIHSGEDVRRLRGAGYQAFLVGESLMKAEQPGEALRRLIAESKAPPVGAVGVPAWSTGTKD